MATFTRARLNLKVDHIEKDYREPKNKYLAYIEGELHTASRVCTFNIIYFCHFCGIASRDYEINIDRA